MNCGQTRSTKSMLLIFNFKYKFYLYVVRNKSNIRRKTLETLWCALIVANNNKVPRSVFKLNECVEKYSYLIVADCYSGDTYVYNK